MCARALICYAKFVIVALLTLLHNVIDRKTKTFIMLKT